jgi:uncharacterized protein YndB with AHSA1/START domain
MTVISTNKDPENLRLTLVAEFDSTPERVWAVWEDPRKLEQWWGPPTWPATFTRHDFVVGGESRFQLTGPNGEVHRGFWRMHAIDKPVRIDFANGLAARSTRCLQGSLSISESVFRPVPTDDTRLLSTCFAPISTTTASRCSTLHNRVVSRPPTTPTRQHSSICSVRTSWLLPCPSFSATSWSERSWRASSSHAPPGPSRHALPGGWRTTPTSMSPRPRRRPASGEGRPGPSPCRAALVDLV